MTLAHEPLGFDDGAQLARAWIEHRPELVRFLRSRTRCAETAEDAAQETWLRAQAAKPPIRNPKALLFEIAANVVRNLARSNQRRATLDSYADLIAPPASASPETCLLDAEALARARRVIETLPPQCGQVFRLHRFDGLTQREVAARLAISTTAVEKHMRKAMSRLAQAVERA